MINALIRQLNNPLHGTSESTRMDIIATEIDKLLFYTANTIHVPTPQVLSLY